MADSQAKVAVAEEPWGIHYKIKAYAADGRERFAMISDISVRGKAALRAAAVPFAAVPVALSCCTIFAVNLSFLLCFVLHCSRHHQPLRSKPRHFQQQPRPRAQTRHPALGRLRLKLDFSVVQAIQILL